MVNFESAMSGRSRHTVLNTAGVLSLIPDDRGIVTLDMDLLGLRDVVSGAMALSNLADVTFTLTYATIIPAGGDVIGSWWAFFGYETENILKYEAGARVLKIDASQ